jgi:hypothetical protein
MYEGPANHHPTYIGREPFSSLHRALENVAAHDAIENLELKKRFLSSFTKSLNKRD